MTFSVETYLLSRMAQLMRETVLQISSPKP